MAGRIDRDEWTGKDGAKRDRIYIVANSIDFLSPKTASDEPVRETATA